MRLVIVIKVNFMRTEIIKKGLLCMSQDHSIQEIMMKKEKKLKELIHLKIKFVLKGLSINQDFKREQFSIQMVTNLQENFKTKIN